MYEMKRRVTYSEVDLHLQVNIAGIAQFLQDCTLFHSESVGKGLEEVDKSQTAWFLSSWQIEVLRNPVFGEEITVRTWPHAFKGMYGYRNFDILDADGNRIVQANSIWIFMDLKKMLPAKPTEQDRAGYVLEPALSMEYAQRRIRVLEEEKRIEQTFTPIPVRRSFLDSNLHVNNGRYITEALELLWPDCKVKKLRVDYRKAATETDVLYPSVYEEGTVRQVVFSKEDGTPYVIIEAEQEIV